ncbi:MAG: hypothetical protein AAGD25_24410 [Cyanobacteria bacterium P01_F01_bin.150]
MNSQLVLVAIIALLIGICFGACTIFLIFTVRRKILANSLADSQTLIGHLCTVQVPLDHHSKGKISVRLYHSTRELMAITESPHCFRKGDRALIMNVQNNQAWIVPETVFLVHGEEESKEVHREVKREI